MTNNTWVYWRRSLHGWRDRVRQAEADRATLQSQFNESAQRRLTLEAELGQQQAGIDKAGQERAALAAKLAEAERLLVEAQRERDEARSAHSRLNTDAERVRGDVLFHRNRADKAEVEGQQARARLAERRRLLDMAHDESARNRADLIEMTGLLAAARSSFDEQQQRAAAAETERADLHRRLDESQRLLASAHAEIARLSADVIRQMEALAAARADSDPSLESFAIAPNLGETPHPAQPASGAGEPDDLEIILGIGPVFARRLVAAGITTFEALADLPDERLLEIVEAKDWQNIDLDSWRQQARDRAAQK